MEKNENGTFRHEVLKNTTTSTTTTTINCDVGGKGLCLCTLDPCSCKLKWATKWKWSRRWKKAWQQKASASHKMYLLLLFACHFSIINVVPTMSSGWCVCFPPCYVHIARLQQQSPAPSLSHIAIPIYPFLVMYATSTRLLSLILLFFTLWWCWCWWWCWGNWESITSARAKAKKCKLRDEKQISHSPRHHEVRKGNFFGFISASLFLCSLMQHDCQPWVQLISWINL